MSVASALSDWIIPVSGATGIVLFTAVRRLLTKQAEMPSAFAPAISELLRGRSVRKILNSLEPDKLKQLKNVKATRDALELSFWQRED